MRRAQPKLRGFTTIELLVVLLILALLATVALTSLANRTASDAVGAEARKIAKLLSTARSYALAENGYFQAVLRLDSPAYWIDETDQAGAVVKPKIVTPEPVDDLVAVPEARVDSQVIGSGMVRVRFFPQGNSSEASIFLIRKGADRNQLSLYETVRVYGPTGAVAVLHGRTP
jgi:prepilin-type N-terminal cleavage/methylation domain-containing protein